MSAAREWEKFEEIARQKGLSDPEPLDDSFGTLQIEDGEDISVESALNQLVIQRFSMPPATIAAFRQAAQKGALRLLEMVNDDTKFDKLKLHEKLKVLEMVFDRAYGKSETASTSAMAAFRTGQTGKSDDHSAQLEAIQKRMLTKRRRNPALPGPSRDSLFPELASTQRRARREAPAQSSLPTTEEEWQAYEEEGMRELAAQREEAEQRNRSDTVVPISSRRQR